MNLDDTFAAFFAVIFIVAVGDWLVMRKLSPKQKHYWTPRLSLLNIALLGPFFIVPPLVWGRFEMAILLLAVLIIVGYIGVAKVRVCESCGHVAEPDNVLFAARFCPKCGAELTAAKLFGTKRAYKPG